MHILPKDDYERKLILLRDDVVLMMHLFYRRGAHSIESAVLQDENDKYLEADYSVYEESAKQFMLQLEGNSCISFLEALKAEIEKELDRQYKQIEEWKKERKENENQN